MLTDAIAVFGHVGDPRAERIDLRAGYVQRRDAKACRDRLLQSEVRVLGAVLNCYSALGGRYRSGYSGGYAEESYGATPESSAGKVAAL